MKTRRAAKVDANQKEIVRSLRSIPGVSVAITSTVGDGFPDIVIGFRGVNYLIELKDGNKTKSARALTEHQIEFHASWRGNVKTCKSLEEIFDVIGLRS